MFEEIAAVPRSVNGEKGTFVGEILWFEAFEAMSVWTAEEA